MHWGRHCTTPPELPDAGLGDMPKGRSSSLGRGVNAFFCIVSHWQGVKISKGGLKLHNFQCIRGGSILTPMSCRTLGRAMRQKACHQVLVEACMDVFVSFLVRSAWENAMHG